MHEVGHNLTVCRTFQETKVKYLCPSKCQHVSSTKYCKSRCSSERVSHDGHVLVSLALDL